MSNQNSAADRVNRQQENVINGLYSDVINNQDGQYDAGADFLQHFKDRLARNIEKGVYTKENYGSALPSHDDSDEV